MPLLPQVRSLCWRFIADFCGVIAGQIGTLLQQIPSVTRNNRNNAPTLVKSTNLLGFCTCFHRLIGRSVSLTDDPLGHRSWEPEGWKKKQPAQAGS
jgi:hypothetical protein